MKDEKLTRYKVQFHLSLSAGHCRLQEGWPAVRKLEEMIFKNEKVLGMLGDGAQPRGSDVLMYGDNLQQTSRRPLS